MAFLYFLKKDRTEVVLDIASSDVYGNNINLQTKARMEKGLGDVNVLLYYEKPMNLGLNEVFQISVGLEPLVKYSAEVKKR